jgi:hypothetical protein
MQRSELVELIHGMGQNLIPGSNVNFSREFSERIADAIMKRWILLDQDSCPTCLSTDPKMHGSGPNPCADAWHNKNAEN